MVVTVDAVVGTHPTRWSQGSKRDCDCKEGVNCLKCV